MICSLDCCNKLVFVFFLSLSSGFLCLCTVWWKQSSLFHDPRQDFSSELVEAVWFDKGSLTSRVFWDLHNLELFATGVQTCTDAALHVHVCTGITGVRFLFVLKMRLQCSWCCKVLAIRCYLSLRFGITLESNRLWDFVFFLQLQNSLALNDSVC